MFVDQVDPLLLHKPDQNFVYVRSGGVFDWTKQVIHHSLELCGGICEPHNIYCPLVDPYGSVGAGVLSTVGVHWLLVESLFQFDDGKGCFF